MSREFNHLSTNVFWKVDCVFCPSSLPLKIVIPLHISGLERLYLSP